MTDYIRLLITYLGRLLGPRTPGRHTAAYLSQRPTPRHRSTPAPQHPHTTTSPDPAYLNDPVDRGAWVRPYVLAHAQRRAAVLTSLHTCGTGATR
jgi:hypothetical protein